MQLNSKSDEEEQGMQKLDQAQRILDNIGVACYEIDNNGIFLYVNKKAEELLGYKKESLLRRNMWHVFPELASSTLFSTIKKVVKNKQTYLHDFIYPVTNIRLAISAAPSAAGIIVTTVETSEVRATKAQLLEEQHRLKMVNKVSKIGYYEFQLDSDEVYADDEVYRMHGLERKGEFLPHDDLFSYIHPDDQEIYRLQLQEGLARKLPFEVTNRIVLNKGEVRLIHRRAEFWRDKQGNMNRVCVTLEDITPQATAGLVWHNRNEICFELDNNFRVININRKASEIWNKHPSEVLGKWLWSVFPEYLGTQFHKTILRASTENTEFRTEAVCPVLKKWVHLKASPSVSGLLITKLDISELISIRQQLEAKDDLLKESEKAAHIGSYEYDVQTNQLYFSEGMYRILGYEPNSFEPTLDFIDSISNDADALEVKQVFQKAIENKEPYEYLRRIQKPGSETRFILSRGKVITDEDGNAVKLLGVATDITRQKQAEENFDVTYAELLESKDLLQSVFDTSLVAMAVFQAVRSEDGSVKDFRIKIVNKEFEKITGRNDLVNRLYAQEYPGIRESGLFDVMLKVMATGEPQQTEYYYGHEGFEQWFSSMFVKLNDGLVATNLDITKRKHAEQERLKHFTLLRQSEEMAQMGSWEYDISNDKFTWSDGMYRLFEIEKGTAVKTDIYLQYATNKFRHGAEQFIRALLQGASDFENVLEIKVGERIKVLHLKAIVDRDDSGRALRMLGLHMDITALRQAEEQMKENSDLIKSIANAAPDMLYVIDIGKMQLVYANENLINLFRKSLEELTEFGSLLFDAIVYPSDREKYDRHISALRSANNDDVQELVYRMVDGTGAMHWIKTRSTVFKRDEQGRPTHAIGVSQDITEQVSLQEKNEQLLRTQTNIQEQQQREVLKAILITQEEERKRIAESLHNGLGQILYGVKMSLSQIDAHKAATDPNEVIKAKRYTDQLLTEAINESRRLSHELTPTILEDFGLKVAIQKICQQFANALDIRCEFTGLNRDLSRHVEITIYRTLQELVINIIKHAEATEAIVKTDISANAVNLLVQDNGVGLTDQNNNSGIGWRTIQNKLKLFNGTMSVSWAKYEGTTINITIPTEEN